VHLNNFDVLMWSARIYALQLCVLFCVKVALWPNRIAKIVTVFKQVFQHDVFFYHSQIGISSLWFPLHTKPQDFSISFWIIAENKLCDQQRLTVLTRFVQQGNIHKLTQLLWILKAFSQNLINLGWWTWKCKKKKKANS